MGLLFSSLFDRFYGTKKEWRILMVGLDNAGKTTILFKLKFGEVVSSIPTIGFNVETVEYKNLRFTVWDIGGQERVRGLWKYYYQNSKAVIFVVDSNDGDRLAVAREELVAMLADYELNNAVLLVLANKQDLPNAQSVAEIGEKLGLSALNREWFIQGSCAVSGSGLYEGLEWIANHLKQ